jgi:hypothetical protein
MRRLGGTTDTRPERLFQDEIDGRRQGGLVSQTGAGKIKHHVVIIKIN